VVCGLRERMLQPQQLIDFQIRPVGKWHSLSLTGGAGVLLESVAR
jgi:hypothetical protein